MLFFRVVSTGIRVEIQNPGVKSFNEILKKKYYLARYFRQYLFVSRNLYLET